MMKHKWEWWPGANTPDGPVEGHLYCERCQDIYIDPEDILVVEGLANSNRDEECDG